MLDDKNIDIILNTLFQTYKDIPDEETIEKDSYIACITKLIERSKGAKNAKTICEMTLKAVLNGLGESVSAKKLISVEKYLTMLQEIFEHFQEILTDQGYGF